MDRLYVCMFLLVAMCDGWSVHLRGLAKKAATVSIASVLLSTGPPAMLPQQLAFAADSAALLDAGLERSERQIINLFDEATESVVFINTYFEQRTPQIQPLEMLSGTGSGFVWSQNRNVGYIVTNYHVVRNSNKALVTVKRGDGTSATYLAGVRGVDPDKDTAVLEIDVGSNQLKPIKVGTSKGLRVGQSTFAIGNPFGLDHSLTTGIVSGLGREIKSVSDRPISNTIQTDAAINPGNSGGPLLDSHGRLIGMNTAIYSTSGSSGGVGFAIPVDTLSQVVSALIRDGRIDRAAIGISYLNPKLATGLGIKEGICESPAFIILFFDSTLHFCFSPSDPLPLPHPHTHTVVLNAPPDSQAAKAGLQGTVRTSTGAIKLGDIIVSFDGRPVADESDLFEALDQSKPGQAVRLGILRYSDPQLGLAAEPQRFDVQLELSKAAVPK